MTRVQVSSREDRKVRRALTAANGGVAPVDDPRPPTGVRLVLHDGAEVPVQVSYVGTDGAGLAVWAVVVDPGRSVSGVAGLRIDHLPGRTGVVMRGLLPLGDARESGECGDG